MKENLSGKIIEIINTGKENIFRAGMTVANQKSSLISDTKSFSSGKELFFKRTIQNLAVLTSGALSSNNIRLEGLENTLNILKPENVLQRGYTITSLNGRVLKLSDQLIIDDLIDTQFSDGKVRSRVMEKKRGKGEKVKGGNGERENGRKL